MRAWAVKDDLGTLFVGSVSITKGNAEGWAEIQRKEMRRIGKPDVFVVVPVTEIEEGASHDK